MSRNKVPKRDHEEFKRRLIRVLGRGKVRALPGPLLAYHCEYGANGSDRLTRMMIRELIADGIPVASSTGKPAGFFIAETSEEVKEYMDQLTDRIREDAKRRRDFKRAARRITHPEQLRMTIY